MKQALIISGGTIEEDFALCYFMHRNYQYIIAADRGLLFLQRNGIRPTHIVGDFDSAGEACLEPYRELPGVEIRQFPPEKDWTDTEIAVKLARELGCERAEILGGTGSRLDHVLGNVQVLALGLETGMDCILLDAHNRVSMHGAPFKLLRGEQWGKYVSLFAYGGDVTGLTLRGFKYPVENFTLGAVGSLAVSNEIEAETAELSFRTGRLLVVESRD